MPLVHAAIIPDAVHTPHIVEKSLDAIKDVAGEFYSMQPDTLAIISPATQTFHPGLYINIAQTTVFSPAGDQSGTPSIDTALSMHVKSAVDAKSLDHTSVATLEPLSEATNEIIKSITDHFQKIQIVDLRITTFGDDFTFEHLAAVAREIGIEVNATNARVGLLICGEFGSVGDSQSFYHAALEAITTHSMKSLLTYPADHAQAIAATIYTPLLFAMHLIQSATAKTTLVQAIEDNGRGYIVANTSTL